MTTPAQNVNQTLKRPCDRVHWTTSPSGIDSAKTTSVYANRPYRWISNVRPASGNTPPGGFRPCRGWSHSGRDLTYPPNRVQVLQYSGATKVWDEYYDGCFWNVNVPAVPSIPSAVINAAELEALTRLKDQDIHLGNFIAEFGQTERLIGSSITRIAASVRKWRRRNPVKLWDDVKRFQRGGCGRQYARRIPASWLELQYGWRPLLSDIFGAIQHLGKPDRDPLISVKGYEKRSDQVNQSVTGLYGGSCVLGFNVEHECWVKLHYKLNSPGLAEVSSLGLINPVEIVWELSPYSFVVDWVFPIGPWLGALTADAGFSFIGGSSSRMSRFPEGGRVVSYNWGNSPPGRTTGDLPVVEGNAFSFQRTCYTSSPVPGIYVKNPLSAVHVANAIALLVQAFR